jgi:hypothetical protein
MHLARSKQGSGAQLLRPLRSRATCNPYLTSTFAGRLPSCQAGRSVAQRLENAVLKAEQAEWATVQAQAAGKAGLGEAEVVEHPDQLLVADER